MAPPPAVAPASSGSDDETLATFLAALSLDKYEPLFTKEEISLKDLALLSETDLKDIGVPMGPRRQIQGAFARRNA